MNAQFRRECRCRCGCLLAKVTLPVTVSFAPEAVGIEIRCRRCKSHAVLQPSTEVVVDDDLRAAE